MKVTLLSLTLGLTLGLSATVEAQQTVQASDMIEIFEKLGGSFAGHRKAHANGVCAQGQFEPAASEHFAGAKLLTQGNLPVTLRFSVGGGNPNSDERAPGTRGAGIQIKLSDGSLHNFTGNNFPVFAGKDVETFHGFLSTLLPDENGKRDPQATLKYIQQHPSVQAHAAWQQQAQTAASYANTEFFGIHTFFFSDKDGQKTKFRWHLVPDLGVETLSKEEAAQKPEQFLASTLQGQVEQGKVSFTLQAVIGEEQDSDIDPSQQWPAERPVVSLGKITLTEAGGDACTPINFDPNVVSQGFASSDDPVLRMRSPAYAISFGKRLSNQ